ncbi:MAG: Magnesium and cobalt transport protein CorA [uncultured Nocardioidaceae bacterium]|uniref:Magnesium and cobalt transport protein CorA n=1 Tax=uncultured Nocardioidaceae bacterium TaxID=253824 RepID=A0A6J4LFW8_9ACTN|nr:MAG: Magnesium and cobalt transport protein CorA [uncultured Nocardioidaceae bacterium]
MGLHEPDAVEMKQVAAMFGLHPLAVEDSLTDHQRPKVEPYDDMLFVVVKTLWYVEERDEVESGQVSVFLGQDFVVTVRQGAGVSLAAVRADLEAREHLLGFGPAAVAYAVCDRIVDGYEEVAAELEADVDEVEASVFSQDRTQDTQRIYVLKREVAEVRRAVQPLRVPMQRFAAATYPFVPAESANFFRDVADHVTRVTDVVETLDMLLSTAFDAHLARISVQQSEDMRKISAWVAIAAVGTLVAGIYGMNFDHMPELHWRYGYAWALALMVGASLVLHRVFKRSGWL